MKCKAEELELIVYEADLAVLALTSYMLENIPGITTLQQKMMVIRDKASDLLNSETKTN